jgi:hypothetical protein
MHKNGLTFAMQHEIVGLDAAKIASNPILA